jgi:AcrR family transcriptional regulator
MSRNLRIQRKEKRRQENRRYILEAAEDIFARRGFTQSSVDDIAEKAQFSKATIYRYFDSKLEIFSAIVLNSFREARDEIEKIRRSSATAESKIKHMILFILGYYQRKQKIARIFFFEPELMKKILGMDMKSHMMPYETKEHVPEDFRQMVQYMFQSSCAIIREGISNGEFRNVDAEEAAYIFGVILRGSHFGGSIRERKYSLEQSADLLHDYFLNGIRRKKE